MESKDLLIPLDKISLRDRIGVVPFKIGAKPRPGSEEDIALEVESSSPSPSASMSPRTPADSAPLSASTDPSLESPVAETSSGREPSSGVQRTRASSSASAPAKSGESREKRKRSRVTPEQLTQLELFFAADRSPTAARRKEISDLLGMQERQTQIWFQNRRAKAKLLDSKRPKQDWSDEPPDTPPQLSAGFEADLHNLIHEELPVSIIPCSDLSIGNWRRISMGRHDLIAYICEAKRCLTWFIHSEGYGFKMEIPFDIIVDTKFQQTSARQGLASFFLSHPPTFYLENVLSPESAGVHGIPLKVWKKCSDWTEGTQASQVFRHDLLGSAAQLTLVLDSLRDYRSRRSASIYGTVSGTQSASSASSVTLQIPPPPLASLQTDLRSDLLGQTRKRSASGPPYTHGLSYGGHGFPSISTEVSPSTSFSSHQSAGFPPSSYLPPAEVGGTSHSPIDTSSYSLQFSQRPRSETFSTAPHQHEQPQLRSSVPQFLTTAVAHPLIQRPYGDESLQRSQGRMFSPFHLTDAHRRTSPAASSSSLLQPPLRDPSRGTGISNISAGTSEDTPSASDISSSIPFYTQNEPRAAPQNLSPSEQVSQHPYADVPRGQASTSSTSKGLPDLPPSVNP